MGLEGLARFEMLETLQSIHELVLSAADRRFDGFGHPQFGLVPALNGWNLKRQAVIAERLRGTRWERLHALDDRFTVNLSETDVENYIGEFALSRRNPEGLPTERSELGSLGIWCKHVAAPRRRHGTRRVGAHNHLVSRPGQERWLCYGRVGRGA